MQVYRYPARDQWSRIIARPQVEKQNMADTVSEVLNAVKEEGDDAVRHYSRIFDKVTLKDFAVTKKEWDDALNSIPVTLKDAIDLAAANIRTYHEKQTTPVQKVETMPGISCWRKSVPIDKVGFYIPGGTAPLFSTILMLGIPASIAGCKQIILCTPPQKDGPVHPAILYAAKITGISKVIKIGGVQAVAAMAYGTETISKVDKIFGPGNQYVTAAKQFVQMEGVAIDMPAGPSEVCVLADHEATPEFVAADLISQAEHGADSQVLLVSTSDDIVRLTLAEIDRQLALLPRKELAKPALENSRAVVLTDLSHAIELVNAYAPEHLIIACRHDEDIASRITSAGSVFLGSWSPESAGDYATGTNHVLPTNGYAKAYSGISVESFQKKISFQKLSRQGLNAIAPAVITMAEAEGLDGHAAAVKIRLRKK